MPTMLQFWSTCQCGLPRQRSNPRLFRFATTLALWYEVACDAIRHVSKAVLLRVSLASEQRARGPHAFYALDLWFNYSL